MANMNGRHYRDHRRVDERLDDDQRYNFNARNGGLVSSGNGSVTGPAGNSLSLEELFINGVGPAREAGIRYDHGGSAASAQDMIRLDHPRPDVLRERNEYVDVTRNAAPNRRHQRASARQSTGHFPTTGSRLIAGQADEGLQPAHRAHSVPLSVSSMACSPVMAPVYLDGGSTSRHDHCSCTGRPLLSAISPMCVQPNFDRTRISGPSKSAAALTSLTNGCHPSTSSAVNKLPVPGRVVRVSNNSSSSSRNGSVILPTSSVISSQPRNLSCNSFDKKTVTGKRAGDCCVNNATSCRQSASLFESADCSSSSLMCKHCGRCRCAACTTPRTVPSRWLCNNSCLLSTDSVVDAASCMCCVKGSLYHMGVDSNEYFDERYEAENSDRCAKPTTSSDNVSGSSVWSCSPFGSKNCCIRWGILSSAILCLPCIWCYFPMKACASGVESVYSRYHDHGCRCDRQSVRSEKRHSGRSPTHTMNGGDRSVTRRLRRKRSHTLPPELPSIAAAKAAACNGYDGISTGCSGASEYS